MSPEPPLYMYSTHFKSMGMNSSKQIKTNLPLQTPSPLITSIKITPSQIKYTNIESPFMEQTPPYWF